MTGERNQPRRLYVIGDVHGEYPALVSILEQIFASGYDSETDHIIQLGDFVDGGTSTRECVDLLRRLDNTNSMTVLLGNHEDLLLRAMGQHEKQSNFRVWWSQGGRATHLSYAPDFNDAAAPFLLESLWRNRSTQGKTELKGYVPPRQLENDIEWIKTLPLFYEDEHTIVVHAGLRPPFPPLANSRRDMLWIREEFFNVPYDWPKTIVYGHTARQDFLIEGKLVGIDLMWHGIGNVGAVALEQGNVVQTFRSSVTE